MPVHSFRKIQGEIPRNSTDFKLGLKSDEKEAVLHWVLETTLKVKGGRLE